MSKASMPNLEDELVSSPSLFLAAMLAVPVGLALLAWNLDQPDLMLNLSLGMFVAIALTGLAAKPLPKLAAGGTIAMVLALAFVLRLSLQQTNGFLLAAVGVAVAGAIGSGRAALVTAVVATGMVLLMPARFGISIGLVELGATLMGIWLTALAVSRHDRPARRLAQWSIAHYESAQGLLSVARDRQVELKQALEALAHANRQLELSNERIAIMRRIAEEAQRTKSTFVSNVSHEFRTPLNIIIGLAEILAAGADVYGQALPEGAQQDIAILYRNTEHLSRMVNDVLDLSQVEAGKLPLRREWVDVRTLIEGSLTTVPPLLERKDLYLHVDIDEGLSSLYCDAVRVRQVILNLVSNATRYSDQGGITVRAQRQGERAVISVQDTGPGISPADQQRIFEPFQQSLDVRAREGSGLGLSISRELVEMHQGHMWVESTLGHGSTFFFSLPLGLPASHGAPPERWITEGWVARDQSATQSGDQRQRMMIIEPGDELAPLFSRYADVDCVRAANLEDALRLQTQDPVQVVVVNAFKAAEVSGQVAQVGSAIPEVPVIGFSVAPRTGRSLNLDVIDYLLKPVHAAELADVLRKVSDIRRILIVDDDPDTLWVLERHLAVLAMQGVVVQTATDGATALRMMQDWLPDLVLLDVVLPDMSGWQVLDAKNEVLAIRDIPVAMISAQNLVDAPISSSLVAATMGTGMTWEKMLRSVRSLSDLLQNPS